MAEKYFEKEIGSRRYRATALPARKALALKVRLAGLIGPGLSGIKIPDMNGVDSFGDLTGSDGKTLGPAEIKIVATVVSAIGGLFATVSPEKIDSLINSMLEGVDTVEGDKFVSVISCFDDIYRGDLGELYRVLGEVFILNFPFLLGGPLAGIIGAVQRIGSGKK